MYERVLYIRNKLRVSLQERSKERTLAKKALDFFFLFLFLFIVSTDIHLNRKDSCQAPLLNGSKESYLIVGWGSTNIT
jgi:hypothetical protein